MQLNLAHVAPMSICADAEVHDYVEAEALNFNPYHRHRTAWELLKAARRKFGDARVDDLEFYVH